LQAKPRGFGAKRQEEVIKRSNQERKGRRTKAKAKAKATGREKRVCFDWENGFSQSASTTVFGRTRVQILSESQQIYRVLNSWVLSYHITRGIRPLEVQRRLEIRRQNDNL
jgi:hypothetical protein